MGEERDGKPHENPPPPPPEALCQPPPPKDQFSLYGMPPYNGVKL